MARNAAHSTFVSVRQRLRESGRCEFTFRCSLGPLSRAVDGTTVPSYGYILVCHSRGASGKLPRLSEWVRLPGSARTAFGRSWEKTQRTTDINFLPIVPPPKNRGNKSRRPGIVKKAGGSCSLSTLFKFVF